MSDSNYAAPLPNGGLDQHVADAVSRFMQRLALPILIERGTRQELIGTGTLFDISGRIIIVTAKHIFVGEDLRAVAIPARPEGPKTDYIGGHRLIVHREKDGHSPDVCIIEVENETLARHIVNTWTVLKLEDTAEASADGRFVVCGFPSQLIEPIGASNSANLLGTLLAFYTNRIPPPSNALAPVNPELDLFFNHEGKVKLISGAPSDSPRFQGVSGASIWQILPAPQGSFWTPQSSLKVVGIQSTARHGDYLRGENWLHVRSLIEGLS